jgi:hypothetical protein
LAKRKKRNRGQTWILATFETLPKAQLDKRVVEVESIDHKGLTHRTRVMNQTPCDQLYLDEVITSSQHEAAHMLLSALIRSGCSPKSAALETISHTAFADVGNAISSRIMAFSSAYRNLAKNVGPEAANCLILFLVSTGPPKTVVIKFRNRIVEIQESLRILSLFYGTGSKDTRSLVREGG